MPRRSYSDETADGCFAHAFRVRGLFGPNAFVILTAYQAKLRAGAYASEPILESGDDGPLEIAATLE